MKRNEWLALIATTLMMLAVCQSALAKDSKTVERGMTKQQVEAILGKPKLTSFDASGDRWEYRSGVSLSGNVRRTLVGFDLSGRVVSYDSQLVPVYDSGTAGSREPRRGGEVGCPVVPGYYDASLDEASFGILQGKIQRAGFDSTKYDLIEVACLGCCFTCQQTAELMKFFSFSDERLKVLGLMASRIVDVQNAATIYRLFTFDRDKDKAADIISRSR